MGTSIASRDLAVVSNFYRASTWVEGKAAAQVAELAALDHVTAVAAFPDLHPGKFGPVGVAADVDGAIYAGLVGNDIGCGVALAATDLEAHRLNLERTIDRLAILDDPETGSTMFGTPLGSIGGGNHFCELTTVKTVFDEVAARDAGLGKGVVNLLVHTGSRSVGTAVFEATLRDHGAGPLTGDAAARYLVAHDEAMAFAKANRWSVIERAARAIRAEARLLSDVQHNFVAAEDGVFRHRKGASSARRGLCVVLGSRGTLSYVVEPRPATPGALVSLAHGAGRKIDRATARAKFGGKGAIEKQSRNPFGGRVVCNDKHLAAEEAPGAYKSIDQVIEDLASFGLIRVVATLQPLLTFKTAGGER